MSNSTIMRKSDKTWPSLDDVENIALRNGVYTGINVARIICNPDHPKDGMLMYNLENGTIHRVVSVYGDDAGQKVSYFTPSNKQKQIIKIPNDFGRMIEYLTVPLTR